MVSPLQPCSVMPDYPGPFHRHRFPSEIICHAVWLYYRLALSFRDVEELLFERTVVVTYETIRARVDKFGAEPSPHLRNLYFCIDFCG